MLKEDCLIYSLKNKIAIVTGSEGSIGMAIVKGYRKYGAKVYGWDIKKGIDVTDIDRIKILFGRVYKKEGKIDILVNCAAVTLPQKAERYSREAWDKTLLVNLFVPFKLSQEAFRYMKKSGGSIINITSLFSELGFSDNPAYGASKGGLKQLTKCLAVEWAEYNIRVNNLGFGYVKTNMTKKSWQNKRLRDKRTERIPLGRWAEPVDVVGSAIFLASNASKYITGQDIYVDGGWLVKGL